MENAPNIEDAARKSGTALARAQAAAEKAQAAAKAARERAEQARRKVQRLAERAAGPQRKADTQAKILLGATLLQSPSLRAQVEALMLPATRQKYLAALERAKPAPAPPHGA